MLGALYAAGIGEVAHGPMPGDINRADGEAAVAVRVQLLRARLPDQDTPQTSRAVSITKRSLARCASTAMSH